MFKNGKKKYFLLSIAIIMIVAILGITKLASYDKYAGKIKVTKAYLTDINTKLQTNIINSNNDGTITTSGYDEVDYVVRYTLSEEEGVSNRKVSIKGTLPVNERFAAFKPITGEGITSNLSEDMKEINITVENSKVGEENAITLKMLIQGAPDGYTVTPNIEIKESTEPRYRGVSVRGVEVNTNSLSGTVRDEDNAYVSNILIALVKNKEIIKETYTDENGQYVFSDVEAGKYTILIDEEIYEKLEEKEINVQDEVVYNLVIRQVEPYKLQTHKYIKKLKLINGGNELVYEYDDVSRVQQSIRKLDKIKGEIYYKVVVENVGEKTGIVTMIKDELPAGLSFDQNKNLGWELIDGVIYNRSLQGVSLNKGQKREDTLILDINETDEARTYLNKITAKGEVYEKVTFIVDGTIYKEYDVLEGEKIKNETIIEDSFDGWYTDNKYTNKYNFNNPVIKDLILYGKTNITHTVTFNDKNPETSEETEWKTSVIENGNTVAEPESPSHTGYTFKKWVDENGVPWDFDNPVERDLVLTSTYDINKYKVEFYNQTGESDYELVNTIYVDYKDVITTTPEVSRQYYTFKHWSLTKNGEAFDFETKITGNTKLYSVYIINTHTVDYYDKDPETGEETRISSDVVNEGTKATEPENVPEHTGYVLDHWVTDEGDTWNFDDPVLEDLKLITTHRKKSYKVEYYNGDTKLDTQNYLYKELIDTTLSPTATKEGHTFTFWSLDGESTSYDFTTPVTSNIKLYANFVINKNQVIFNDENRITEVEVEYGNTVNPIANQGKDHYEFVWWSLEQSGEAFDFTTPITSPTILYAVYEPEIELVTFNDKNPSTKEISLYDTQNVVYGEKATRPTDPEHAGYTFLYWEDADENIYDFNERVYDNITLVSKYRMIKYTITYNLFGGKLEEGKTNPSIYTIETNDFTLNNPSKVGYDFIGWTIADEEPVMEKTITKGTTGNLTLTANYRPIVYNITYELDGGALEEGKINPLTYTIEDEITLNNPIKEGFDFVGWIGTNLGGNTLKVVIPSGSMGDRNYKAKYRGLTHKVKFINEGNQYGVIQTVNHNEKAITPSTNPTKDYYIFKGWVKENGDLFDFNTPIIEDLTLYSSFEEVEAPIITHSPTEWTNQDVTVNITSSHNDYSYQYRVGDGSLTNYTGSFMVGENTTIVAKSLNDNIESRLSTHEITNIDKIKPVIDLLAEENVQGTSFDINFIAYDNESGMNYVQVYIKSSLESDYSYEASVYYNSDEELKNYNFTDLTEGETYSVKIVAFDKAGNASDAEEIEVTTTSTPIVARIISINGVDLDSQNYIDFPLLADAIADSNCETKCTIQMVTGTNESVEIASTQDIKLDVNGKTISGVKEGYTIQNLGELTVIDTGAKAGTILNRTGIALKGEDDSTLTIGEDDNTVSTTAPYIFGRTYGLYNSQDAEFNFYDGKIEGRTAIQGLVNETPYAYNTVVSTRTGNQIATLKRIGDPEARIKSVYYTKVKNAVDDAENGMVNGETTEETTILDSFETKGLYGFTYDSENNTLTSNNDLLGTTARTTLTIDLTDYENSQFFVIEGHIEGTGVDSVVVKENDIDGIEIASGNGASSISSKGSLTYMLEPGKKYYVSIAFRTTYGGTEPTDDTHTDSKLVISKATLIPTERTNDLEDTDVVIKNYGFDYYEEDGTYRSNNQYTTASLAFGSVEIDLTNETEYKDIIVNATLETYSGGTRYSAIFVTESNEPYLSYETPGKEYYYVYNQPDCIGYTYLWDSSGIFGSWGPYNYTKTVEPGKKYYVQFYYYKMWSDTSMEAYLANLNRDQFIINSVDVVDSMQSYDISLDELITVDSSHKYLKIDLTNSNNDKTLKTYFDGSVSDTSAYAVVTQNDVDPTVVPSKTDAFIDVEREEISSNSYGVYFPVNLEAGKVNYVHFVNMPYLKKFRVTNGKMLDIDEMEVFSGSPFTRDYPHYSPSNLYKIKDVTNPLNDSFIKIDLTNEDYDQYLRIDASMYYYGEQYFYITKDPVGVSYQQIMADKKAGLLFYHDQNQRRYYARKYYNNEYYDDILSSYSHQEYVSDYNYVLKKGNVYYLHFVQSEYRTNRSSGWTGSLALADVLIKPVENSATLKLGRKAMYDKDSGSGLTPKEIEGVILKDETEDKNTRFISLNAKNYIRFNDELWRIVGIFDTEDESGNSARRLKIMRDESIGNYSWDGSHPSNYGFGTNLWSESDLMQLLNPGYESETNGGSLYWNKSSGNCYVGQNSTISCDFTSTGLSNDAKQFIEEVKWNVGMSRDPSTNVATLSYYSNEKQATWIGKVGLITYGDIYYSGDDYMPVSTGSPTRATCMAGTASLAMNCLATNSWLFSKLKNNENYWTITGSNMDPPSYLVFVLGKSDSGGVYLNIPSSYASYAVYPTVYLSTKTHVTGGTGTRKNPFTIELKNDDNEDDYYGVVDFGEDEEEEEEKDFIEEEDDGIELDKMEIYPFIYDETNNIYRNSNSNVTSTLAAKSFKYDLRNEVEPKNIIITMNSSSYNNSQYFYIFKNTLPSLDGIIVRDSSKQSTYGPYICNDETDFGYCPMSNETIIKNITLSPGNVYYIEFLSYVNRIGDSLEFKIENANIADETDDFTKYTAVNEYNEEVDTIQLLKNIALNEPLIIEPTKKVILDLNGYQLTSNTSEPPIKNNGYLTIIDSRLSEGSGLVSSVTNNYGAYLELDEGKITTLNNYGEFKGLEDGYVVTLNDLEAADILDGAARIDNLKIGSDNDTYEGYSVTTSITVDANATINSINNNEQYKPSVTINEKGVLELNNAEVGSIRNSGLLIIDENVKASSFTTSGSYEYPNNRNALSKIDGLTLTYDYTIGEYSKVDITNSSGRSLELNGGTFNADNITLSSSSTMNKGTASFDNSILNGELKIYGDGVYYEGTGNNKVYINDSTINNSINHYIGDTSYNYYNDYGLYIDGTTINGNVELYNGELTIDNSTANNVTIYDVMFNSTNSTFKNITNSHTRLAYTYYSSRARRYITEYHYYRCGTSNLTNLTINDGNIINNNNMNINGATFTTSSSSLTAILNNKGAYASEEGGCYANLKVDGEVEINNYDKGITSNNSQNIVTLGTKDEVVNEYPIIKGTTNGLSIGASIFNFYDGKAISVNGNSTFDGVSDIAPGHDIVYKQDTNPNETVYLTIQADDAVASIGDTTYGTLVAAFDAAETDTENPVEIKLLKDIKTAASIIVPDNKNIKFNYNGHSVNFIGKYAFIENNGTLEVMDDSGDPKENITISENHYKNTGTFIYNGVINKRSKSYTRIIDNYGTAIVNSGTFLSTSSNFVQLTDSNVSTSIDDTIINEAGGNLTINDGNLNGLVNYGTAVINGGKFTGTYLVYANEGDLLVEGGDYSELPYGKFVTTSTYTIQTIITGVSFTKLNIGENYSKMIINDSTLSGSLDNKYHVRQICPPDSSWCSSIGLNHFPEDGRLEINNSDLTGTITNYWAKMTMNSGSINVTDANAIDAEASYIDIKGGTINSNKTAIKCTSTTCFTTIGTKGDADELGNLIVSKTNPDITGSDYVYNTTVTSSVFYFYDGILHGSISGNITEIETDYDIIQPEGTQTRYLDKLPLAEILDINGDPTVLQCGETEPADCYKLQTAFDKVGEGETVKLLRHFNNTSTDPVITVSADKNFTFDVNSNPLNISNNNFIKNSGTLNVTNSGSFNIKSSSDGYIIENDGTLNIEGSGTITYTSEYSTMIKNLAGGTASIKNAAFTIGSGPASIECTNRPIPIINNGDIVMDSVTITSSLGCQLLKSNGNMTLKDSSISQNYGTKYYKWPSGSSVIGTRPEGYSNYGISEHVITSVGNLTFNNTNISRVGNLYENLNARDHDIINSDGTLTIEGGSFNSAWDVFTHTKGTTKIKNATISNQKDVIVYDGDVEVTNSTFTNSKETVFKATTAVSTLTIDKGTYSTEGKLNIRTWRESGGEVEDVKYVDWFAPVANIGSSTMTIKDGTFSNDNHYVIYGSSNSNLTILDGTLTSSTTSAIDYVGTVTLGTNDGTVSQTKPSINGGSSVISRAEYINFYDGLLTGSGDNLPITEGITRLTPETGYTVVGGKNTRYLDQVNLIKNVTNGGTLYTDAQDAIDNASSGDELQFVTNIYVTDLVTIPEGKEITLDVNGLAIQKTVVNNGTLNIVDKSNPDGQDGYQTSSKYNGFIEEITNNGTLNVNNGVIHVVDTDISSTVNVTDGIVKTLNNSDTLNITGGTVYKLNNTGAHATITDGIVNEIKNSGHADINSGTINTINNEVGGSINITSGNIVGPADTNQYSIKNKGDINISGGTFAGNNIISNENGGEINISGGTFNNSTRFIMNYNGGIINFENIDFTSNGDVINNGEINFINSNYGNNKHVSGSGTINASDSTLPNLGYSYVNNYGTTEYVNGSNKISINNSTIGLIYANNLELIESVSKDIRSTSGRIKDNIIEGNLNVGGTVINNDITGNVSLTDSEFRYNVVQGNVSNSGETLMTDNAINGGVTNSGSLTITSGTIDNPNGVGIVNNGSLILGEDDENVSTTIPSVKGSTIGIEGGLNFYDGVVTGSKTETAITGSVNTPENYIVRSYTDDEAGTISAILEQNGEEDSRVIVVNKINFDDIQAAIDYSAANGQPDMVLYVDYTLTYDLIVPDGVTIVLKLNGYHLLNPDGNNIPDNLVIQDENNQNVSGSLSKFLANVLSNDSKDIIIYEMDDGSKLSAERVYKLYKLENGTYNIVNMNKEEEIGRYTTGNSLEEMRTVRSRIYINKLETGTYKLVDDRNKEINFTVSSDSVSDNIRENNSNTTLGKVIASDTAELILNIQTGIIKVNYLAILLIITFAIVLLLVTKKKKQEE